jgi:hypothetical protein
MAALIPTAQIFATIKISGNICGRTNPIRFPLASSRVGNVHHPLDFTR